MVIGIGIGISIGIVVSIGIVIVVGIVICINIGIGIRIGIVELLHFGWFIQIREHSSITSSSYPPPPPPSKKGWPWWSRISSTVATLQMSSFINLSC